MKNNLSIITITILLIGFSACMKDKIGESNEDTFQYLWSEMSENYGGFQARNINWDSLYTIYQPQALNAGSQDELWTVCTQLLNHLDDSHVSIVDTKTDNGFISGWENDEEVAIEEFDLALITSNYLEADFTTIKNSEGDLIHGMVKDKNIAYIHLPHFVSQGNEEWHLDFDNVINSFSETEGLILDLRNNFGGITAINRYISGRFAATKELAFYVRTKNGVGANDFDEPTDYYMEPKGANPYTKPIVVLINKATRSSGEEVVLYFETQNHIKIIGEPTSNAFSDTGFDRFMPNGWKFKFPVQYYQYPDGSSPEGVGIIPDIMIKNEISDIESRQDKVLEEGISQF